MSAHAVTRISPDEYLELERASETKSEYFDGLMVAMSGGLLAHSLIATRMATALSNGLDGRGCEVANSDLRVRVSSQGPFFYPDVSVYCGEPELTDEYKDTLLNPVVVIEVLSKSSEAYDRGHKFAAYRRMPSLREYVLVSQTEPRIEVFPKDDHGRWMYTDFVGMEAVCDLPGIACQIALEDIYKRIKLDAAG